MAPRIIIAVAVTMIAAEARAATLEPVSVEARTAFAERPLSADVGEFSPGLAPPPFVGGLGAPVHDPRATVFGRRVPTHDLTLSGLTTGLATWLLSAAVVGVALTASVPEMWSPDDGLTLENVARRLGLVRRPPTGVPTWARSLARAIGVVTLSRRGSGSSTSSSGVRFELMLLPLGPAHAAGLSVSGAFG